MSALNNGLWSTKTLAIAISPIALAPVAGVVAYSCMRNGCGKEVGHGLQIHCHESTIACTDTSYFLLIDISVFLAELACRPDDVVCHTLASGIDVAC